jgi:hypothetical protein
MPQITETHKLPTQVCEITAGDGRVLMILILHATKHYNTHMRAHLLSETVHTPLHKCGRNSTSETFLFTYI